MKRLLFLACLLPATPALAQIDSREGIALQNQIYELRQQLQQVQQQPQGQSSPQQYQPPQAAPNPSQDGDTTAQLLVRLSALEEQTRQLQGRVDDLTNQLQRQNDDLTKQIGDLAFKLGQAPSAPSGGLSQPGLPQPGAPAPALPPAARPAQRRPPEMALREGNAALARRDYAAATAAAREVLAGGNSPRGTDAQLLLARAEGGQHQYQQSAADFFDAYNRAPRAPSAPVALLGVANALLALNDQKDACQALAKLDVEFPKPSPGIRTAAASARKRAACH